MINIRSSLGGVVHDGGVVFSPWTTYCEIFHSHKPMGFYLGGLYNMKTW